MQRSSCSQGYFMPPISDHFSTGGWPDFFDETLARENFMLFMRQVAPSAGWHAAVRLTKPVPEIHAGRTDSLQAITGLNQFVIGSENAHR